MKNFYQEDPLLRAALEKYYVATRQGIGSTLMDHYMSNIVVFVRAGRINRERVEVCKPLEFSNGGKLMGVLGPYQSGLEVTTMPLTILDGKGRTRVIPTGKILAAIPKRILTSNPGLSS